MWCITTFCNLKKLYFIAGEPSGDLHGANLIKQLLAQQPNLEIRGWGGDLMQEAGAIITKHYRELAFMGFVEVVKNLPTILKNFKVCKQEIEAFKPDGVVLIDYPGFNLRMAKHIHKLGIKVYYYILPQAWAWKQNRANALRDNTTKMFSILPFEQKFFEKFNANVDYVGHPLIDAIEDFRKKITEKIKSDKPILALLPGSRKQEITAMLPKMVAAAKAFSQFKVIVAGAPSQDEAFYSQFLKAVPEFELIFGKTYELLNSAHTALVASGTATLETALFKVPQVVCYKGGAISVMIARLLIKVNFISLVNLIMDREVVKELIQGEMNANAIKSELEKIVVGPHRDKMKSNYQTLIEKLGGGGASQLTASLLLKTL